MSQLKPLNIGVIGYGFMGRTHSNGYKRVNDFFPELGHRPVLKAICGRSEEQLRKFADQWQYESTETDWRRLLDRSDIDAIDICTPNNSHAEIAIAAAQAGKMVLCEKPLAMDPAEGQKMVDAVEAAGVANTVWYNYRRVPAVSLAKQLIDEGRLGRIFHYRANFLQDWTINADLPQGGTALWRLDAAAAGSGVTGDLLAHCIDTAIWLNGSIASVTAMTETFVKERKHNLTGKVEKSASMMPALSSAASATDHLVCSNPPATHADTKLSTPSKSTVKKLRFAGTCTTCTGSNTSTTPITRSFAAGTRYTAPTVICPTWANGGCPACRLATSTHLYTRWPTLSHQSKPDGPAIQPSEMPSKPRKSARQCWTARNVVCGRKLRSPSEFFGVYFLAIRLTGRLKHASAARFFFARKGFS
jgi:predicted dehydrogenase